MCMWKIQSFPHTSESETLEIVLEHRKTDEITIKMNKSGLVPIKNHKWVHLKIKGASGCYTLQRVRCFILVISTDCYSMLSFSVKAKVFARAEGTGEALMQRSREVLSEPCHHLSSQDSWISELEVKILWCVFLICLTLAHSATTLVPCTVFDLLFLFCFNGLVLQSRGSTLAKKLPCTVTVLQNLVQRSSHCCVLYC